MWESTTTYHVPAPKSQYEKGKEFAYLEARKIYGNHNPDMGIGHRPSTRKIAEVIVAQDVKSFEIEIPRGYSSEFAKGVDSYVNLLKLYVESVRADSEKEPKIVQVEF